MHRCVRWLTECAPVPGHWPKAHFVTRADEALHEKLVPFLSWWMAYEQKVEQQMGPAYRERGYRQHRKLPKSRAWLPPSVATEWIAGLRDHPQSLPRAALFLTDSSCS